MMPALGGEQLPTRVFVSTYASTADLPDSPGAASPSATGSRTAQGSGSSSFHTARHGSSSRCRGRPRNRPPRCSRWCPRSSVGVSLAGPVARLRTRREGRREREGPRSSRRTPSPCSTPSMSCAGSRRSRSSCSKATSGRCGASRRRCVVRVPTRQAPFDRSSTGRSISRGRMSEEAGTTATDRQALSPSRSAPSTVACSHMIRAPGSDRDPEDLSSAAGRDAAGCARFLRAARPAARPHRQRRRSERSSAGSARRSGPARDLDVLLDRLRRRTSPISERRSVSRVSWSRSSSSACLPARAAIEALEDERYLRLLDRLEAAEEPPAAADAGTETLAGVWSARVEAPPANVRADLDDDSTDQELHSGADSRQTGAVRGGARRARARRPGTAVRRGGEEAPGRPRRAPGRVSWRRGAAHGAGPQEPTRTARPPKRLLAREQARRRRRTRRVAEGVEAGPSTTVAAARTEAVDPSSGGCGRPGPRRRAGDAPRPPPAYDDWSFPKGKAMPDESDEAVRDPRGGGGDRPRVRAPRRASQHQLPRREGSPETGALLAHAPRRWAARLRARGGRGTVAQGGGGARGAHVRPRP